MMDTRTHFHKALDHLKTRLIELGNKAEDAIEFAVQGYLSRDTAACSRVLAMESEIDLAERHIDQLALDILATQQPLAVDLRFITACMKINSDLERVGDHAAAIARRGLTETRLPAIELPIDLSRIAARSAGMIQQALNAFITQDLEMANAVLKTDDLRGRIDDQTWIALVGRMHQAPETLEQLLDALIVVRDLSRVADHATNIAEDVILWVSGMDVRHTAGRIPAATE